MQAFYMLGVMDIIDLRVKRSELQALLGQYESSSITHFAEDDRGELSRDVTSQRIESLKRRIDKLNRKIAAAGGNA